MGKNSRCNTAFKQTNKMQEQPGLFDEMCEVTIITTEKLGPIPAWSLKKYIYWFNHYFSAKPDLASRFNMQKRKHPGFHSLHSSNLNLS